MSKDREQEKEVMEYVIEEWGKRYLFLQLSPITANFIIKAIMRRYDLVPRGE